MGGGVTAILSNTSSAIGPLWTMMTLVSWLIGLGFGISALIQASRIATKGGTDHNRGYGAPLISFAIGVLLVTLPSALEAGTESFFGTRSSAGSVMSYTPPGAQGILSAESLNAIRVALLWVQFIGLCAFIKGLIMAKQTADGTGPQTYGPSMTFIIGGIMCCNITLVLSAVGLTLGTGG